MIVRRCESGLYQFDLAVEGIGNHLVKTIAMLGVQTGNALVYLDYENDTRIYGSIPPKKVNKIRTFRGFPPSKSPCLMRLWGGLMCNVTRFLHNDTR